MEKIPLKRSKVKVVLVDIEGTVCPISFVKEILFPYFIKELPDILDLSWDAPNLRPYIMAFPEEHRGTAADLFSYCADLVAKDIKDPALKALQGHVWLSGYNTGKLNCELYSDVPRCFRDWDEAGIKIVIYSSGSIQAQKLLFGHVSGSQSDLQPLLTGYHDTTTAGPKNDPESYNKIYASFRDEDKGAMWSEELQKVIMKDSWLFLSDNVHEVDAALASGMMSAVVVREGNSPLSDADRESHEIIRDFGELEVPGKGLLSPLLKDVHLKLLNRSIEIHKLPLSSGHHSRHELSHAEKVVAVARKLRQLIEEGPLLEYRDAAFSGEVGGVAGVKRKSNALGAGESNGKKVPPKKLK